jgi:hypothetical protein
MDSPSGDLPVVVIGVKSYGRAPTFLPATGYEQARSVVAALADDWAAARDAQLDLPEPECAPTGKAARVRRAAAAAAERRPR